MRHLEVRREALELKIDQGELLRLAREIAEDASLPSLDFLLGHQAEEILRALPRLPASIHTRRSEYGMRLELAIAE